MKAEYRNKIIFVVVAIIVCICIVVLVFRLFQWVHYNEIDAEIVDIEMDGKDSTGNSISIPALYVIYSYEYNGNTYLVKQKIFSEYGLVKGELKKIRINPQNPKKIFNTYQTIGTIVLAIFLIIFDVLLYFIIRVSKSQ